MQNPSVGRIVHYVSYGTPGGEYGKECRAAVITGNGEPLEYPVHGDGIDDLGPDDAQLVDLCVLNPTGLFFRQGVPQGEGRQDLSTRRTDERDPALCDGKWHEGGTWHWPERT